MQKTTRFLAILLSLFLLVPVLADTSQLVGTWVATREDGASTTWQFNADGTMSAEFDGMEGFKGTWTLNTDVTPHQLDVIADDETVETIVEFTGKDTFRLEIGTANPGDPRPTEFSDMAATFTRQ
ncbi:MAG: hypothetical protein KC800_33760, partial [Candidatus Eremiobacteraeota bacterium]|nr:hypothetical protein [Candidatus Eremiobacteraeota bacterium]